MHRVLYRVPALLAAALVLALPAAAEKRVALVIGNSAYKQVAQLSPIRSTMPTTSPRR